jgi:hypothetical protein
MELYIDHVLRNPNEITLLRIDMSVDTTQEYTDTKDEFIEWIDTMNVFVANLTFQFF